MRPLTLLVLLALVLGLGAFIYFYERDLPSTDERVELAKRVVRVEKDEIDALVIETGEHRVRLERQRPAGEEDDGEREDDPVLSAPVDGWRITEPLDARADRLAVDGLLDALTGLEHSRVVTDADRAALGLDDPRARVTVITGDGETVLEVGAEIPATSDMIAALRGGTTAYQVPKSIFPQLTKEPGDWRDAQLFTGNRNDVERVALETAGNRVLLVKRGLRFWIESPIVDRADETLTRTLLTDLGLLEAKTFLDAPLDPASLGLDTPQGVVEIFTTGVEAPLRVEIGDAKDDAVGIFYARADGQLFEIETGIFHTLERPAEAWRSKTWAAHQVFEIKTARFEDSRLEKPLEIRREDADWWRGEDRVAYSTVSDLLYAVTDSEGVEAVARDVAIARGYRLETPLLRIHLTLDEGEQTLALHPAVDGLAAATADDRDAVVLIPEERIEKIRQPLDALLAAEPLPEDGEEPVEPAADPM